MLKFCNEEFFSLEINLLNSQRIKTSSSQNVALENNSLKNFKEKHFFNDNCSH